MKRDLKHPKRENSFESFKRLEKSVIDGHLMPYVFERGIQKVMKECFLGFLKGGYPNAKMEETMFEEFFIPWFLFDWKEGSIARSYLREQKKAFFIKAVLKSHYSFYRVLSTEEEGIVHIQDLFLMTNHFVKAKGLFLERGDIVFTRIVSLWGNFFLMGTCPWKIKDFEDFFRGERGDELLKEEILELYLVILREMFKIEGEDLDKVGLLS